MKTLRKIAGIIAVIFVIVFGIWLSMAFNINIGKLISKLLGKTEPKNPVDFDGLEIGKSYSIKENPNPLRDKGIVELENGMTLELPKGVIDSDVEKITVIKQGVINVVKKDSTTLTSVFD